MLAFVLLLPWPICIYSIQVGVLDSWPRAVNVCEVAVAEARANGHCTSQYIELVAKDGCVDRDVATGTISAAELIQTKQVTAFVGPPCNSELEDISKLAFFWNTPVVGQGVLDPTDISPKTSPYVIQVSMVSVPAVVASLGELMRELNQPTITLIAPSKQNIRHISLVHTIYNYNMKHDVIKINRLIVIDEAAADWSQVIADVQSSTQMIGISLDFEDVYDVYYNIDLRGLSNYKFVVVVFANGPPQDVVVQQTLRNMLYGANAFIFGLYFPAFRTMYDQMKIMFTDIPIGQFTDYLTVYNACYAYCYGTTLGAIGPLDDYVGVMKNRQFSNIFGEYSFDESATLLTNYAFFAVDSETDFKVVMSINTTSKDCESSVCYSVISTAVDPNFLNDHKNMEVEACILTGTCRNYLPHIVGITSGTVLVVAMLTLYIASRYRRRNNMYRMNWKVSKDVLKIIVNKNADTRMQRELENRKANESGKTSRELLATRRRVFGSYALIGTQKAEFINFRQLKKIKWTEEELKFLYELKQLQHDNITKFLGICCNELDYIYILHGLIDRATLEDFNLDSDFVMDNTFKSAFMRDILRGLQYLHKSQIGFHGFLTSQMCLIDTNWVLKLANFGVSNMVNDLMSKGLIKSADHAPPLVSHSLYTWFAPELMKEFDPTGKIQPRLLRGNAAADIYGVGMILYQMLFRCEPFQQTVFDRPGPALLCDIMHNGHRPAIAHNGEEDMLIDVIVLCWDVDPTVRPKIKMILETVSAVYPASKGNLVDQMMRMNEKYAQNLETIVAERTAMLHEAQDQTMRLLNEILPASIAQTLKVGGIVPPRSYDAATVLFVQLCDFSVLLNRSNPDEVIGFLNDVFDNFDNIIKNHDAYKVETTGETYMVASGVPAENGGRHIFEIAEISLEIREVSYTYVVRHCPEFKIRVRIGFHTGPIAAGVIGIRSPRYCLFGDTVNFASRMQSNCPPNQIQTSEQTARLLLDSFAYKLVKRGIVHVKGKGEVNCYWLNEHIHPDIEDVVLPPARPLTKSGAFATMPSTDLKHT